MPIVEQSTYVAPWFAPGGHVQTILPSITRSRLKIGYDRDRLELEDGDFLDVDWSVAGSSTRNLVVLLHGLEGNSQAPYMTPLVSALNVAGYDAAVLNFRGCSGEMNRLTRFYHSGDTADLDVLLRRVEPRYDSISLVGFSLGGNVVLKYLGEEPEGLPGNVRAAVTYSVPCDLEASARCLESRGNSFYMKRFMRHLCSKVEAKDRLGYEGIDSTGCRNMRTFAEFDNEYTAPLHGFRSAGHYWSESSSFQFLDRIKVPTLLVNAGNDPFLDERCFPVDVAARSSAFFLEMPDGGGHCGFPGRMHSGYWYANRALEFLQRGF